MNILVVCTGNICRSPMAEGLLRQRLAATREGAPIHVHSAGTHGLDGEPAAPLAVQAAAEMGVDISAHRARSLDREMVRRADLILAMEPFHREIVMRALAPGKKRKVQLMAQFDATTDTDSIEDPYQRPLAAYRECIGRLSRCVEEIVRVWA